MSETNVFIPAKPMQTTGAVQEKYWHLLENYKPRERLIEIIGLKKVNGKLELAHLTEDGEVSCYVSRELVSKVAEPLREMDVEVAKRYAEYLIHFYGKGDPSYYYVVEGDRVKIFRRLTAVQAFLDDVECGLVRDPETGLKLSTTQVAGKPPRGGFLQEIAMRLVGQEAYKAYDWAKERGALGYQVGTVVKICGDYDDELRHLHNHYGVITRIIDAYHYEVVIENTLMEKVVIRDIDVKAIVGDVLNDYIGIGPERHRKEIVPLIEKALAGKVPYVPCYQTLWPRPPINHAAAWVAYLYGSLDREAVEVAISEQERKVRKMDWLYFQGKFASEEDYRHMRGHAVLWLKLYRLVLKTLKRLERGERARLIPLKGRKAKRMMDWLASNGIPFIQTQDGIVVPEEYVVNMG